MSDTPAPSPRPVSLAAIVAILGSFALFLVLTYVVYVSHQPPPPQDTPAEELPATMKWEATPEGRAAYLAQLRAQQQKQATTYAWVDQKAGVVQVPIDRAMELIVQEDNAKK